MSRSQRFLVSVLIVVSIPVALHFMAPAQPPAVDAPPTLPLPSLGEERRDLSGHWQGVWEKGTQRLVFSFQIAHRRPEGFIHANGTVTRVHKGFLVDSMLTVSLAGRVGGGTLELGAPPPWTRTTTTGAFAGTLSSDGQRARGEVMGLDGTVLPLELRLLTPAVNRAEGAYTLPKDFPVPD